MKKQLFTTLILIIASSQIALAKDIIVSTTADAGEGSLREAIIEANELPGTDKIIFNIPMSDRGFLAGSITGQNGWAFFVRLEKALPTATEAVVIDGNSQTHFTGDTNEAVPGSSTGAEVIIFLEDTEQTLEQVNFTASNTRSLGNAVLLQAVTLMANNNPQIAIAVGGRIPMR